jgi:glycosyltransferase involved in cell wall biosynthesis
MLEQLIYSPQSPLKQLFYRLPFRWQLKFILAAWEVQYRRRRRRWRWAGSYLSAGLSAVGGGQKGLVSVILPVYNQAHTLAESIDSVLRQSYPYLDLIVVNDGSTDQTPQILERYSTHPHITIINQPNRRLPAALNCGFAQARGEFFTWTSGDNLMHPKQIQSLAGYLQATPEVALVYADYALIDDDGQPIKDAEAVFMRGERGSSTVRPKREPDRLNVGFECVVGPCFMYRRGVQPLIGGYNPALEGSEDYDYWIRIHNFFKVQHIGHNHPLYYYRVHQHTMSARMKPRISRQRRQLMQREQHFQYRLALPLPITIDPSSATLFAQVQPNPRALPVLTFKPASETTLLPDCSSEAALVHLAALTTEPINRHTNSRSLLICWLHSYEPVSPPQKQALNQVDLVIVLGDNSLEAPNVVTASTPEDVYHLARIFVASRRLYAKTQGDTSEDRSGVVSL